MGRKQKLFSVLISLLLVLTIVSVANASIRFLVLKNPELIQNRSSITAYSFEQKIALKMKPFGGSLVDAGKFIPINIVEVPETISEVELQKLEEAIRSESGVIAVEKDMRVFAPKIRKQKTLKNAKETPSSSKTAHLERADVLKAWEMGYRGDPSFIVAVIDSGTDISHDGLRGRVWKNPDTSSPIVNGWNFINKNSNVYDDYGHGTHVSGILAANGTNDIHGVGNFKILPLKALDSNGGGFIGDMILAFDMILELKSKGNMIKGINISINSLPGIGIPDAWRYAIKLLGENDIAVFNSAGNHNVNIDFYDIYPASASEFNLVPVGSLGEFGNRSSFSNYGQNKVKVYAEGEDIWSLFPNQDFGQETGTSMASPFALGCFLLGWSANPSLSLENALGRFYSSIFSTDKKINAVSILNSFLQKNNESIVFGASSPFIFIGEQSNPPFRVFGSNLNNNVFLGNSTINTQATGKGEFTVISSSGNSEWYSLLNADGASTRGVSVTSILADAEETSSISIDNLGCPIGTPYEDGDVLWFVTCGEGANASLVKFSYSSKEHSVFPFPSDLNGMLNKNVVVLKGSDNRIVISGEFAYNWCGSLIFSPETKEFEILPMNNEETRELLQTAVLTPYEDGLVLFVSIDGYYGIIDPLHGSITEKRKMPLSLVNPSLAYYGGTLFVAGGKINGVFEKGTSLIDSNYCIAINVATGSAKNSIMPLPVSGGRLFYNENHLYLLLGNGPFGNGKTSLVANVNEDNVSEWEPLLKTPPCFVTGARENGIIGSVKEKKMLWLYKTPQDNWLFGKTFLPSPGSVGPLPDPAPPTEEAGCSITHGIPGNGLIILLFGLLPLLKKNR